MQPKLVLALDSLPGPFPSGSGTELCLDVYLYETEINKDVTEVTNQTKIMKCSDWLEGWALLKYFSKQISLHCFQAAQWAQKDL